MGTISLSGTKINASRHKAMTCDRIKEEERGSSRRSPGSWLRSRRRTRPRMRRKVATTRQREADELKRRENRLAKILEAKALLRERVCAEMAEEVGQFPMDWSAELWKGVPSQLATASPAHLASDQVKAMGLLLSRD